MARDGKRSLPFRQPQDYIEKRRMHRNDKMLIKPPGNERAKTVIHSVRVSRRISELIRAESRAQRMSVSEYIRRAALSNMRYMGRQALESWGR
jgi:hypothetical protein